MKVTILGSGTILSDIKRNPSGYVLEHDNKSALLDCGPGILHQLDKLKMNVCDLDCLFISHFHLDHCSDVFALLMRRYLSDPVSNETFKIFGPTGLNEWYMKIAGTQGAWLNDRQPKMIEFSSQVIYWHELEISVCRNGHTENSISYLLKDGNKKFFYSSDTDFNTDIIAFAAYSDIAVLECSYPDENPKPGHLTPSKLAKIVDLAAIKKTIVTHIYPENDTKDLIQRIKTLSMSDIEIGFDFMQIDLEG
ncbi:MAG: MBL fold metallo-hydrolase [Calditrichae bacterium]|nr:MBL fold metallo-hydrolase [Calditrichota bacterium]MCB9058088.1 MBL fold metallo-hydrolase [Calditrichia bacterium]